MRPDAAAEHPVLAVTETDFLRAPDRNDPHRENHAEENQRGDVARSDTKCVAGADLHEFFHYEPP